MIGCRLYQPIQKWRVGAAFSAALLIHCAAVAFAVHHYDLATELPPAGEGFPQVDLIPDATDDPTPPPPDVPDPPPSAIPTREFPEERPTLSPVQPRTNTRVTPIVKVKRDVTSGSQSFSTVRISALSAPRPEYPYEARRQRLTGSGIVVITVNDLTGSVTDVAMEVSTGSALLDNAAISGFRRWRFKPGTVSKVRAPVTFALTGAQY